MPEPRKITPTHSVKRTFNYDEDLYPLFTNCTYSRQSLVNPSSAQLGLYQNAPPSQLPACLFLCQLLEFCSDTNLNKLSQAIDLGRNQAPGMQNLRDLCNVTKLLICIAVAPEDGRSGSFRSDNIRLGRRSRKINQQPPNNLPSPSLRSRCQRRRFVSGPDAPSWTVFDGNYPFLFGILFDFLILQIWALSLKMVAASHLR